MISCFRYTFSKDDIDAIIGSSDYRKVNTITFKANDDKEYNLQLNTMNFLVTRDEVFLTEHEYFYDRGLLFPPIAKYDLENNHSLYVMLDPYPNIADKKLYHLDRSAFIIKQEIPLSYIDVFATAINFGDCDDFYLLCFMYIVFRTVGYSESLNDYLIEKLSYYGYEREDFDENRPFNDITNPNYVKLVNLALDIIYKKSIFKIVDLTEYDLTLKKLEMIYNRYYVYGSISF